MQESSKLNRMLMELPAGAADLKAKLQSDKTKLEEMAGERCPKICLFVLVGFAFCGGAN